MNNVTSNRWPIVLLALAVAGCATAPAPAPQEAPRVASRDWLAEIDAEAAKAPSAVDVVPLADPAVQDLRERGDRERAAGRFADAARAYREALALLPNDPSLWQALAEAQLGLSAYPEAEDASQKSYDLGPRVGAICVRNWLTVFASRIERGDAVGAASAKAQVANCRVSAPSRF